MSNSTEKRSGRTIHESGRAGDLHWSAVIEHCDDGVYRISRIDVDGEAGDRSIDNGAHQTLNDALTGIKQMVTGSFPSAGPKPASGTDA